MQRLTLLTSVVLMVHSTQGTLHGNIKVILYKCPQFGNHACYPHPNSRTTSKLPCVPLNVSLSEVSVLVLKLWWRNMDCLVKRLDYTLCIMMENNQVKDIFFLYRLPGTRKTPKESIKTFQLTGRSELRKTAVRLSSL